MIHNGKLLFTEQLLQAVRERLELGESKIAIATSFGINECTLRKRLNAGTVPTSLGRFKPVFTTKIEQQLVDY